MTDFAKISLATDDVRPSAKPESRNIEGFITVTVVLAIMMVAETLSLLKVLVRISILPSKTPLLASRPRC